MENLASEALGEERPPLRGALSMVGWKNGNVMGGGGGEDGG